MAVFTDKFIRGLKPATERYEERDGGCPGLSIRVGVRGEKQWSVVAMQNGKRRRIRLGTYPDVSLAMARRKATEAKAAPSLHIGGLRLHDLWTMYATEMAGTRRAWRDVESVWTQWAEPIIGNVRIEDVNMRHGAELLAHVTKHSSPNRARKVIRYLSPMLAFAAGRGLIPGNPWAGLHLPEGAQPRDRVLTLDEWARLGEWALAAPYPFGPFLRVLMLSGQRLNEVARMRWDEVEGDLWVIPAARHKSKTRHEVPLSAALANLLATIERHDEHVFSTRRGRPIAPGGKLKERIDGATGLEGWRFHDIRRTGATIMAEAGVARFIVERVLGHADQSVTAIYDRATYRAEKRAALDLLGDTVW